MLGVGSRARGIVWVILGEVQLTSAMKRIYYNNWKDLVFFCDHERLVWIYGCVVYFSGVCMLRSMPASRSISHPPAS
jgi:hypothetical protein